MSELWPDSLALRSVRIALDSLQTLAVPVAAIYAKIERLVDYEQRSAAVQHTQRFSGWSHVAASATAGSAGCVGGASRRGSAR